MKEQSEDSEIQSLDDTSKTATPDMARADQKAQSPPSTEKDSYEVGWEGGEADPLCPRSYSTLKKWRITLVICFVSLCMTCASSIYTATYQQMEAELGNSRIVSILGLSLFVLGISFGPMALGPLSEFYGRRPIYVISWTIYVIFIIPQAVAKNIGVILVFRFLDGFAGSAFLAVAGGTIHDLFDRAQLQHPISIFSVSPFIGPSLGPLIGGLICSYLDWRWTYYVLIIWSFALWLAIIFLVPETFHPVLLRDKARKLRKETNNESWFAPIERAHRSVAHAIGNSLLRPFQLLFLEPMCFCLCIFAALLHGILYLFFDAFPLVFVNNHGFNLWQVGLSFLGIGIGMILAIFMNPVWNNARNHLVQKKEQETGIQGASEPEFRLPAAMVGSLIVPVGMFMFGWTTFPWVHWIAPIIGSTIFGFGALLLFTSIFGFLVDAYPTYAASAMAANGFIRCIFAAVFPLFGEHMFEGLGYQWASSLLAFLTVGMIPFPFLFFRYGKLIRGKSRFAKK
ncbi:hypothetical protein PENARI_c006G02618 [Penicillium arizonense]|uniref:Major facilitator superfamily (MFS) profile domain-containing protein n=1 Tax=Penicillium arizonense TaxID=1835702 RepID=A0A1F5LN35_PENAI|nr:hypothetical protein PENARI_c006G02618 [Penicillium arizonense]OGE54339.1 hypothetical protein PENARI_c006G02618 [Penicillium arizonense]